MAGLVGVFWRLRLALTGRLPVVSVLREPNMKAEGRYYGSSLKVLRR